ncbi:MAG: hypothetical protein SPL67_00260, partial [Prevotella sp.]|nr:hypothetical protein [Prevotella sp.]
TLIALMCGKNAIPRVGGRHQAGHYTATKVAYLHGLYPLRRNDWTSGLPDFWTSKKPLFWTSKKLPAYCNDWTSGLPDFWTSKKAPLPDFYKASAYCNDWTSGLLDF